MRLDCPLRKKIKVLTKKEKKCRFVILITLQLPEVIKAKLGVRGSKISTFSDRRGHRGF